MKNWRVTINDDVPTIIEAPDEHAAVLVAAREYGLPSPGAIQKGEHGLYAISTYSRGERSFGYYYASVEGADDNGDAT